MMRKIESMDEIHEILLNIMLSFDTFCKNNDINYSIAAGTMLGAVRHKGFIPWDDDIDVFMLRKEYDKFYDYVRKNDCKIGEYYRVLLPNEAQDYFRAFIQIEDVRTYVPIHSHFKKKYSKGIHIDIFPLDFGYDDYSENLKIVENRNKVFNKTIRICGNSHSNKTISVLKKFYNLGLTIIGMGEKYWIKKNSQIPILPRAKYIGNYSYQNCLEIFLTEKLEEGYTTLEFEGHRFQSFTNYDYMLKTAYGDYMQLPPEEARVCHGEVAYWRD